MRIKSLAFTILLFSVAAYFYGNLIYMNLRPADPILPGWEEFSADNFNRYQAAGEPVLIEIYASWCPTCKAQHEAFEDLEAMGQRPAIRAIRVDFDDHEEFRKSLGIYYTGALLIYQNGQQVAQAAGLVEPDRIRDFLITNMVALKKAG